VVAEEDSEEAGVVKARAVEGSEAEDWAEGWAAKAAGWG
jgi:hypothetical protein